MDTSYVFGMLPGPRVIYKGFSNLMDTKGYLQGMLNRRIPKALLCGVSENAGGNLNASVFKNVPQVILIIR